MYESKLSCFECNYRWTSFLCGWLWSRSTRFLDAGRKLLGFSAIIEVDLILVSVVDFDLILVLGIKFDLISV